MNCLKYLCIIFLFTITAYVYCQDSTTDDIDSLFEEAEAIEPPVKTEPEEDSTSDNIDSLFEEAEDIKIPPGQKEPKKEIDLIEDILQKDNMQLRANFKFMAGYSPGYEYLPWELDKTDDPGFIDTAILSMTSQLSLDFQINSNFRVLQSYTVNFPAFEPTVNEFFVDYDLSKFVFFRIGQQKVTWGISRNFPFTNLPARIPMEFGNKDKIPDNNAYALKMNIPMGIGGIEGLMITRNGFFAEPTKPAMDEIGYGYTFNLAFEAADLTVGTFFHNKLDYRTFFSASTTLFKDIEFYSEALISFDLNYDNLLPPEPDADPEEELKPDIDTVDMAGNIGCILGLFSQKLQINGEYYYNGEESELEVVGSSFPLMYGHNVAAGFVWKLFDDQLKLLTQLKYNFRDDSGIVIPGLSIETFPNLSISLGVPIIFGSEKGKYYINNPDKLNRQMSFILAATLSGKI